MKKILFRLFIASLCLWANALTAQLPSRITLKGVVATDTVGEPAALATVMLLNPADSTLVTFARSDAQGAFAFKNIRNTAYLLKISYVGYLPYQQHLSPAESETVDLGRLTLKPIQRELMEVVIRTAKAPLFIRGDTIEYDATMFKVPPGSTVEDLLRRLPGIEVDEAGNIKAQGRDVRRVYVDGKTFFGSDPKLATKNLGAETISKVQVFDEKSEIARLLGIDDGKEERAMNLELKEEYKKGAFGKATLAGGSDERWASRASYNRFDDRHQFSLIGYGNNINETGVNWEDYSEFKGQGTFQALDGDDFGFGGMPTGIYFSTAEADLLNYFDGRGFTRNAGGGVNYNFDNKKTKANASYVYNQTFLDLEEFARRDNFLNTGAFSNTDTLGRNSFRGNHRIQTRFEHNFDSLNVLVLKGDLRLSRSEDDERRQQRFFDSDASTSTINRIRADNGADQQVWMLNTSAVFRHRFRKPGRAFALSAGYNQEVSDQRERFFSQNQLFIPFERLEQLRTRNLNDADGRQFKSSALYSEPLGERWFWQTFANARYSENDANRQVRAPDRGDARVDSLSVFYGFAEQYYRLGSSIRYLVEGFNATIGLAGQQLALNGRFARDRDLPLLAPPIRRTFEDLIPYASIEVEPTDNLSFDIEYTYRVSAPSFANLQPIPIFTNPAFQSIGNPQLGPERAHNFEFSTFYWDDASFASMGFRFDARWFESQIVYNQRVERSDSLGIITFTRPENVAGGQSLWSYWWGNVPIVKNRLSVSFGGNAGRHLTPAFVNDVRNETDDRNWGLNASINFTPGSKLFFSANGDADFNNISYSIQSDLNQRIRSYSAGASVKWEFVSKTFFESNFNYRFFSNPTFDFRQEVPIVNASVRRLLGPKNRMEMRLAAFDLLNRRITVNQRGTQNFITTSVAPTLARYFMLSVSYNFRGHAGKVGSDREGIIIF
ncbi:MAG: outer membrane beta-barrel protein [Saprospiraceae bacterium]|nr:outer membrane beta-barrel protein [Saprospiraceae bacterium]MDW8229502.1 outer membrane beta-barrel protein [Saprospiraceae bacterium]